jgi:LCP family protein required for cell wall assembly
MIAHFPAGPVRGDGDLDPPRQLGDHSPATARTRSTQAFSFGGPTADGEDGGAATGVRIDHVVIVDFEGFKGHHDELGGVQINVAKSTSDERGSFAAGPQIMDGETALKYVRQRHNLPRR